MKFELGDNVRDLVTGFEGLITGTAQSLSGCTQYLVKPAVPMERKKYERPEGVWIDEGYLKKVGSSSVAKILLAAREPEPNGGPQHNAPSSNR